MHSASARLLQTLPFSINIRKFCPTITIADPGEGPGGPPSPPPSFLDQNETRRAEKIFFETGPPLSQGLDNQAPPLSEGLDPPLHIIRWYFWNDIPPPLKTKSSKLLFKKAIFQFFFLQYWDIS